MIPEIGLKNTVSSPKINSLIFVLTSVDKYWKLPLKPNKSFQIAISSVKLIKI